MIGFCPIPLKTLKKMFCTLFQLPSVCFWESAYSPTRLNTCLKIIRSFVLWSFAGAIIGTVPSLLKESTRESDRDKIDLAWFWTAFIISGLGLYALNFVVGTLSASFLNFVPSWCTAGS